MFLQNVRIVIAINIFEMGGKFSGNHLGNATGASGWMADFGEALPFDAKLYNNAPTSYWHNHFTEEWAALNRKAIKDVNRDSDIISFNRSGFSQSPEQFMLLHAALFCHTNLLIVDMVLCCPLDRQCTGTRIESKEKLSATLEKWTEDRNEGKCTIEWRFIRQHADKKLSKHYVS